MFKITEVTIKKVEKEGSRLVGYAIITIDDCFVIKDIRIINGRKGLFVAFPSKKTEEDFVDICHPLNTETRNMIEDAVLKKFNEE